MKKKIRTKMKMVSTLYLILWTTMTPGFSQVDKIEPRVNLAYYKTGDDVPYIKVLVRKRVDRRYFPMSGVSVNTYFNDDETGAMGSVITNEKGEGIIEMPTGLMDVWHHTNSFEFIATIQETDSTKEVYETLSITKARITIMTNEDSVITSLLEQMEDTVWVPVEEVEMKLFIKRQFGRLLVTTDYLETDEAGMIEAQFKGKIPGDAEGRLVIGSMIEDHDEYGNVIAFITTKWGVPMVDDVSAFEKRTLWSTRDKTPYWLLIFPNLIIAGVWGVIAYLLCLIVRIKRLSKSR
jgi:hypothetical protein